VLKLGWKLLMACGVLVGSTGLENAPWNPVLAHDPVLPQVEGRAQASVSTRAGTAGEWRRTAQGWQRVTDWGGAEGVSAGPAIHPVTVSLLQIVVSALALAIFPVFRGRSNATSLAPPCPTDEWDAEPVAS